MVVSPGVCLGPYQILCAIGAGGMGEVWRARDTTLGRDVALKVLPDQLALDPERLARFKREAQILASLNHPNIATIYGVQESDGVQALVLELVEGETLADRIAPHRVEIVEALTIARQLVEALEVAHEQGIIHRDLKPANIKVRPDGVVKVLDFGLAKTLEPASGMSPGVSQSPTLTSPAMTREGVILGTAAYMSPEQARGLPIDKRADIWAFGCVLYECLTGRAAFGGKTFSDTLVAILEREPDWSVLPLSVPRPTTELLHRCLVKDAKRRLRDIGDARFHLDESLKDGNASVRRRVLTEQDVEFRRLTDFTGEKESPSISPDGKMIAFVAMVGGKRQIWIRLLAGGTSLQLTRDDVDHEQPRWAPDSSTLIYFTPPAIRGEEGAIWEIGALGGPPRRVVSATGGGDISHDGHRIAVFQPADDALTLAIVTRDGTPVEHVLLSGGGYTYGSPRWSPDDRAIAFLRSSGKTWDVYLDVLSLSDRCPQQVARGAWLKGCCWSSEGSSLVYSSARRSTLRYPLTFELRLVARDGQRDRQLTVGDDSYIEPDSRHDGKLVAARIRSQSDIWRFPVDGSSLENTRDAIRVTRQTGQVQTPSVSPDEREIVYLSDSGGHGNLWVARTDGSYVRQLTFERDPEVGIGLPLWSPAGREIVFVVNRGAHAELCTIRPDGSHLRRVVSQAILPSWSPDGRWLYYLSRVEGAERIERMSADGGSPVVVRGERGAEGPQISADGSTLYYARAVRIEVFGFWGADREICRAQPEGGPSQVIGYVPAGRIPVAPGAHQIVLSPDGHWLAMMLLDGATTNIWALPTAGGGIKQLTDFGDRSILIARHVSWSRDSRYLYAAVAESETDIVLFDGLDLSI